MSSCPVGHLADNEATQLAGCDTEASKTQAF